ncbi:putative phage tail protein [Sutterella wadsworthensis]|nr:putative phage tail protein [Sutterella wadsworthensis]
MLDAILYALAREAARVDERANAVLEEADPRSSIEELERWFDEWGIPSECLAAIADPSREQMRQELLAKITSNLGLTAAFFESLAGTLGYQAKVTIFTEHTVDSTVDDALWDEQWTTVMTLGITIRSDGNAEYFDVTWGVDEHLARWGNALLECMIRALAPAHVYVIFIYEEEA